MCSKHSCRSLKSVHTDKRAGKCCGTLQSMTPTFAKNASLYRLTDSHATICNLSSEVTCTKGYPFHWWKKHLWLQCSKWDIQPRGGRSNRPYADSLPLSSRFQGGGGGGAGSGGGGLGPAEGEGGTRTPTYTAQNDPLIAVDIFAVCMLAKKIATGGGGAW